MNFRDHLLLLLLVTSASSLIDEVFIEQPGPSPLFIPTGTPAQLNCSVIDGYSISWAVRLPGSAPDSVPLLTSSAGVLSALMEMGITIQNTSSSTVRSSQLNVEEAVDDEDNNGTMAACVAVSEANVLDTCDSEEVQVIYFGPPSTPTNLMATVNGVRSLMISWSSPFPIDGVIVEFALTATNLNVSSSLPITVAGIQEQFYIFTVENATSCDVYSFQVMASNDAGSTSFSEILTSSLPLLPDISAVEDSLEQSLVKTADGVTLSVIFQGITSCPEYPVTSYTLVLVDSEDTETRESSAVTSGEITLVINGLMEDAQFTYSIVATNVVGDSVSTVQNITTTDVQGVSICLVENSTYSIQCNYITGSDARGCVYTLVSETNSTASISNNISRTADLEGVQIDLPNIAEFSILLAFDLENDSSIGTVPVVGDLTSIPRCLSTEASSSGFPVGAIVGIAVGASILLVLLVVAVLIGIVFTCKKDFCARRREKHGHSSDEEATERYNTVIHRSDDNLIAGNEVPEKPKMEPKVENDSGIYDTLCASKTPKEEAVGTNPGPPPQVEYQVLESNPVYSPPQHFPGGIHNDNTTMPSGTLQHHIYKPPQGHFLPDTASSSLSPQQPIPTQYAQVTSPGPPEYAPVLKSQTNV